VADGPPDVASDPATVILAFGIVPIPRLRSGSPDRRTWRDRSPARPRRPQDGAHRAEPFAPLGKPPAGPVVLRRRQMGHRTKHDGSWILWE